MPQKPNKGKLSEKSEQVRIREPLLERPGDPVSVKFVAFTKTEALDCFLRFLWGAGFPTSVICYLNMPGKPTSVDVYDLFNGLFKPIASETKGISPIRSGRLEASWKLNKNGFKKLIEEIGRELGEEWSDIFCNVLEHIGKN